MLFQIIALLSAQSQNEILLEHASAPDAVSIVVTASCLNHRFSIESIGYDEQRAELKASVDSRDVPVDGVINEIGAKAIFSITAGTCWIQNDKPAMTWHIEYAKREGPSGQDAKAMLRSSPDGVEVLK